MPHTIRILAVAILAMPLFAHANSSSVILNGIVNIEYAAIKIDQRTLSGGGRLDANDRYQKSIGDPTFFSRMGLNIREDLGGGLAAIAKIEYAFAPGAGVVAWRSIGVGLARDHGDGARVAP